MSRVRPHLPNRNPGEREWRNQPDSGMYLNFQSSTAFESTLLIRIRDSPSLAVLVGFLTYQKLKVKPRIVPRSCSVCVPCQFYGSCLQNSLT